MKIYEYLFLSLFAIASSGCGYAVQYETTSDKSSLFEESRIRMDKSTENADYVLLPEERYQTIDGFGAALTWASCYNLQKMKESERTELLNELFNRESGLGISLARVTIGASDFNLEEYTWCDEPGLDNFKADSRDQEVVFPILRQIYEINPELKLIASPWSVPKWMKMKVDGSGPFDSWTSGRLDPRYYDAYAHYLLNWVKVMQSQGFRISAITLQNEPLNHGNSMSTFMPWQDQLDFIKGSLGKLFESEAPDVKILVFDHNYNYDGYEDQDKYPLHIFDDPTASKYVAGSAWHNYNGDVSELKSIAERAPDKSIYFTEASIGEWYYDFGTCMICDFEQIFMETMKYGNSGVTLWNLVLDDFNGPYSPQEGSCRTCYGVVKLSSVDYRILERTSHYYDIAHASKVVHPGAKRIALKPNTHYDGIECLSFLNPDGSFAVLCCNSDVDGEARELTFSSPGRSVKTLSYPGSILSLIWKD